MTAVAARLAQGHRDDAIPRESRRGMFRSLRVRNYRLYASGQLISLTGTWMQRVAQDWLVLDLTNSGTALGFVTALQFAPSLLLSLWGGVLADRSDKRRLLLMTQTGLALVALALGLLDVAGVVQLLARAGARVRAGCDQCGRHPGAAVVRGGDGRPRRPGQRGRDQLHDLQPGPRRRPGGGRRDDHGGRYRVGFHRQCGIQHRGADGAGSDAHERTAPVAAAGPGPRAIARGLALRAGPCRSGRDDDPGLRRRHLRFELPDHHRTDRQAGVPSQRDRLRAAVHRARGRARASVRCWPPGALSGRRSCS